jgi:monoamine oxidase
MISTTPYDYFIVGAGIAGLYCAIRLREAHPNARIAIAEAYSSAGGRVVTYSPPTTKVRWEAGAGRIHSSHTYVHGLLRRYGLTTIPIDPDSIWRPVGGTPQADTWSSFAKILVDTLSTLSEKDLVTHTIEQLLHKVIGAEETKALLQHFPYRSEVMVMRADVALNSFRNELGHSDNFTVVKEGLGELIHRMYAEAENSGTRIFLKHRLTAVRPMPNGYTKLLFKPGTIYTAHHVLLTLPRDSLIGVAPFARLPALRHMKSSPLLRTYAVFPKQDTQAPWHASLKKTITDSPLRYVIPVGQALMISYTDGDDTARWKKILDSEGEKKLGGYLVSEARRLFPEYEIPNPLFFKAHYWPDGAYYWTPGLYDPAEISKSIMRPMAHAFPNLYVAGESYSLRQAWMEGALEHADQMLSTYLL